MRALIVLVALAGLSACGFYRNKGLWPDRPAFQVDAGANIVAMAFSPDSKMLASAGLQDAGVVLWDVTSSPQQIRRLGSAATDALAFSPDGKLLAVAGDDRTVRIFDIATGSMKQSFAGQGGIAFSPDGNLLAFDALNRTLGIWEAQSGTVRTSPTPEGETRYVAFSPNGYVVATAADQTLALRDVSKGSLLRLKGHTDSVWGIAFSPDGKILASGSYDQTIRIWDTSSGETVRALSEPIPPEDRVMPGRFMVNSLAFCPDGQLVAGSDNTIRMWDMAAGKEAGNYTAGKHDGASPGQVAVSPDGRLLAAGLYNKIAIWKLKK